MAPIKALCSQRFDDWKEKFGPIGLNCKELTGDTLMDDLFEIQHAHIIMTTPVGVIYTLLFPWFIRKYLFLFIKKKVKKKYKVEGQIYLHYKNKQKIIVFWVYKGYLQINKQKTTNKIGKIDKR